MNRRAATLVLAAVTLLLAMQIYYLKRLPGSLVRVYHTAEIDDFNRAPTGGFWVTFDGTPFDYRIPHRIEQGAFQEIADSLEQDNPDGMERVVRIALWVRKKMHFGERDYDTFAIKAADLANAPDGLRGWCDLYARMFAIACQSLGIPARIIELDGHVVPEAFVGEASRWVMVDPTFGYSMFRGTDPLSVVELIQCYRQGISPTPAVFAETRGDDCLYSERDEINLREIYLNGFTVVSRPTVDFREIRRSVVEQGTLLIAKVQFLDENSMLMGYKESMARKVLAVTGTVWLVMLAVVVLRKW